ncbi:hypothetical protein D3C80_1525020 [compost metagenome]
MIFIGFAEKHAKHNMFPQKIKVTTAVACAQSSLTNESLNASFFHGINDMFGTFRPDHTFITRAEST